MSPRRFILPALIAGIFIGTLTIWFNAGFSAVFFPDRTPSAAASEYATPSQQAVAAALLALKLPDTQGVIHPLSQWQGRILVINFWATWCPPCLREIPDFSIVSHQLKNQPVQFIGISIDETSRVQAFQQKTDVPYPLLIAPSRTLELTAPLGNTAQGLPFTMIIDQKDTIQHIQLGPLNAYELEGKIRALLPPEIAPEHIQD